MVFMINEYICNIDSEIKILRNVNPVLNKNRVEKLQEQKQKLINFKKGI